MYHPQENERLQQDCNSLVQELGRSRLELKEAKAQASKHQLADGRLILVCPFLILLVLAQVVNVTRCRIYHSLKTVSVVKYARTACTTPTCM